MAHEQAALQQQLRLKSPAQQQQQQQILSFQHFTDLLKTHVACAAATRAADAGAAKAVADTAVTAAAKWTTAML